MNPGTPRVGIGYDVHRLASRRKLTLGGVRIPYRLGLLGHSDADVLIHSMCDALLGAASLGDIGKHFPDTNRRYKNISSLALLDRVGKLLRDNDFEIVHLDSTLILQRPKIQQYVPRMRQNVARVLGIRKDQVSIKATTNEGLGFAGRGEGGAALAVATILPLHKR
jgi:2-C-methyl-D-erythritol 2,4-cyclodiphosphate synthase